MPMEVNNKQNDSGQYAPNDIELQKNNPDFWLLIPELGTKKNQIKVNTILQAQKRPCIFKSKKKSQKPKKPIIFWDIDDIILNSSKTIVNIINKTYRIPNNLPPKTIHDIKDWGLKSIYRDLTQEQIYSIFGSIEFWNEVKIMDGFLELAESGILSKYTNIFVTTTGLNIAKQKYAYMCNILSAYDLLKYFSGMIAITENVNYNKNVVDMSGAIQIDDNFGNLINTNAGLKILMKQGLETEFNNSFGNYKEMPENLYEVNYYDEIESILRFGLEKKSGLL